MANRVPMKYIGILKVVGLYLYKRVLSPLFIRILTNFVSVDFMKEKNNDL